MIADPLAALRAFSAPILSDVLDSLGLMQQAMRPFVRPLDDELVLIGRARTGLYMPVYQVREGENPYEVEIALVDDLRPGEIPVLACGGPTERIAPWGELLTTLPSAYSGVCPNSNLAAASNSRYVGVVTENSPA